jgi:YbaB/EbfC DNA-binding family
MVDDDAGLDAAERWVDDWQSRFEEQAARARALSQRVGDLTATATNEDGTVEVTVGSSGALTGLRLDEAIRGRPAAETAEQIVALTRAAQARLAQRAAAAVEETVGRDSAAGRAVIDTYARILNPPANGDPSAAR